MEIPKAIIDAIDLNIRRTPAALLVDNKTVENNQRTRCPENFVKSLVGLKVGTQSLSEEVCRRYDLVSLAQPLLKQITQAPPHRIANQQRTGKHRHRGRNTNHHREV